MKKVKLISLALFALLALSPAQSETQNAQQIWRDQTKNVDLRVEDLLSRLTLDEKINYLNSEIPAIERLGIEEYIWYSEALHGFVSWNCTSFPQNNAMGSTWDRGLMLEVANAISDEARVMRNKGVKETMIFSPTVNMARDPRWGRNEECYSEDPYHMAEIAKMYVRGMQGTNPDHLKTVATIKHFVANNVEHRREHLQSMVSERDLYEYYFPAYKACIVDEGAEGVMSALNGLNGKPCSADEWLLTDVLRKQWGFKGYVIADWGAVGGVSKNQKYRPTLAEGSAAALKAGCDQECFRRCPSPMVNGIREAVKQGLVSEADIDVSVRRLLRLLFLVGEYDAKGSSPYDKIPASILESEDHLALARKAAEKSFVLLKNEDNILPLDKNEVKSIAVVGPFADRCWLGIYSGFPKNQVSPLQGIRERFKGEINFAPGCAASPKNDTLDMAKAIEAARKSDVVIAFVGNDNETSTENRDRKTLHLPGRQEEMLDKLSALGKKLIVVIIPSGSTIIGDKAQTQADGILCAWPGGQEQGNAIARALFGEVNPGGKLNTTWFASDSDLPDLHDYNVQNERTYMYFSGKPLYPYGFGLSYTDFEISNMQLSTKKLADGETLQVSVDVQNVGERAGDEVVQLYIKSLKHRLSMPAKALKGFERVELKAGEKKTIKMEIPHSAFSYWDEEKDCFRVDAGAFEIQVGSSSVDVSEAIKIKVEQGIVPEHSLRTVKREAKPQIKSSWQKAAVDGMSGATQSESTASSSKLVKGKSNDFEVLFVDPGYYVSTWNIDINYETKLKNAECSFVLAGSHLDNYSLEAGQTKHAIKIPMPNYGLKQKLSVIAPAGVKIKSITVYNAFDNKPQIYLPQSK